MKQKVSDKINNTETKLDSTLLKVAVLGSTKGTDLEALVKAINSGVLKGKARIDLVLSNKPDAYILERAKKHDINTVLIESKGKSREDFDKEVSKALTKYNIQLVVLIGYMRYLSPWFVKKYENRIMNIHPSLLPAFAGGMDKNVHEEILKWGSKVTGCTLHFVDEGADTGPIIIQRAIPILASETVDSLKRRVQLEECKAIVEGVRLFAEGRLHVDGRIVRISNP